MPRGSVISCYHVAVCGFLQKQVTRQEVNLGAQSQQTIKYKEEEEASVVFLKWKEEQKVCSGRVNNKVC